MTLRVPRALLALALLLTSPGLAPYAAAAGAFGKGGVPKPGAVLPLPGIPAVLAPALPPGLPGTPALPETPAVPASPEAGAPLVPAAPADAFAPAVPALPPSAAAAQGPRDPQAQARRPAEHAAPADSTLAAPVPGPSADPAPSLESASAEASRLMDGAAPRASEPPAVPAPADAAPASRPRRAARFLERASGLAAVRTFFQYGLAVQKQADLLSDERLEPAARVAAARALGRLARPETIELLGSAAERASEASVRAAAGEALDAVAAQWTPALLKVLKVHPLAGVRADAARELGVIARRGASPELIEALAYEGAMDLDPEVKLTAVAALSGVAHPKALAALAAMRDRAADENLRSALTVAVARVSGLLAAAGGIHYTPPAGDLGEGKQPLYIAALKRVIAVSAVFTAVEFVGGLLIGSLSLQADSMHLAADVAINAGALFAIWMSRRPPNSRKSYGYLKMESLMGLLSAAAISGMAAFTLFEAVTRLLHPQPVSGPATMVLALAGLASNALSTLFLYRYREENLSMKGAFLHAATDAVGSLGIVLGGVLIMAFGWLAADPIISGLIVLLIVHTTWDLAKRSWNILIDAVPAGLSLEAVEADLLAVEGVAGVYDLHVWSLNSSERVLTAVLLMKPGADHPAALAAAAAMLRAKHRIRHATLQPQAL